MRKDLFQELVASVEEMHAIQSGRATPSRVTTAGSLLKSDSLDIARLRARLKLSQTKFATLLGVSADTLLLWEEGRRTPEGPAKVLLRIVAANPEALLSATNAATTQQRSIR